MLPEFKARYLLSDANQAVPTASKGSSKGVEGVMFYKAELGQMVEIRPFREVPGTPATGFTFAKTPFGKAGTSLLADPCQHS